MHLHLHDEVRLCWFIVNIVIMTPETPSALSDSRSRSLYLSLSAAGHALVDEVQREIQMKTTPTQLRDALIRFVYLLNLGLVARLGLCFDFARTTRRMRVIMAQRRWGAASGLP